MFEFWQQWEESTCREGFHLESRREPCWPRGRCPAASSRCGTSWSAPPAASPASRMGGIQCLMWPTVMNPVFFLVLFRMQRCIFELIQMLCSRRHLSLQLPTVAFLILPLCWSRSEPTFDMTWERQCLDRCVHLEDPKSTSPKLSVWTWAMSKLYKIEERSLEDTQARNYDRY